MLLQAREDQPDLGVHPEATERQERPQGEQRPDGPARLDPVGQPAPQHVPQADAAEDDPDHAGPDRQATRPTCRATSRLDTSSRIMMHRLLKNART